MKTASWIVLAIAGTLILLGGVVSAFIAYGGAEDILMPGGPTVQALDAMHPGLGVALRGRRATAGAFAAAYALLFLYVVFVPYRRGEVWSWWALLAGSLALAVLVLARVPALDTSRGAATGLIQFAVVAVGLLLDVRRVTSGPGPGPSAT